MNIESVIEKCKALKLKAIAEHLRSLSRKLSQFFINFTLSISKEYVSWLTLFLESLSTFYPFDNSLAPPSSESIR
jgi:hypothetical protein